jgi:hypothetical protein
MSASRPESLGFALAQESQGALWDLHGSRLLGRQVYPVGPFQSDHERAPTAPGKGDDAGMVPRLGPISFEVSAWSLNDR